MYTTIINNDYINYFLSYKMSINVHKIETPLSLNFLEKYINRGIRYYNKEPFYQRLSLLSKKSD
jgi:hypothetical protein